MKILYVARHGPHYNEDERAISYALNKLGHSITYVQETDAHEVTDHNYDFSLFHKFGDLDLLDRWPKEKPKCFWYFDLVEHDDFELAECSQVRRQWTERATELFNLGFMTDGDWVAKHPGKLVHLMQGADERVVGMGVPIQAEHPGVLFTGSTIHGSKRVEFVQDLQARYGRKFKMIGDRARSRIHGRELANLMASVPIIVAPDSPITDLYCSNRIYQALGFGAFLLHPRVKMLEQSFNDGEDLVFYDSRAHLHSLIRHYLRPSSIEYRKQISRSGLERIKREHLYRHRCTKLIEIVRERFKL